MAYNAYGFRARAVHTNRTLLATAAYMDWSAKLHRLHESRQGREVFLHWWPACEVQHFPTHFGRLPEWPGFLAPVRIIACVATDCRRCQEGGGVFQFPWIGSYARRAVLVELGVVQAWAQVSASQDRLSDNEVLHAWSGLTIDDDVLLTHVNCLVFVISEHEHARLATAKDLRHVWRLWQQGGRRWRELAYEAAIADPVPRAGRCGASLRGLCTLRVLRVQSTMPHPFLRSSISRTASRWQVTRRKARNQEADDSGLALVHAAAVARSQTASASRPPLPRQYKPAPPDGWIKQQAAVAEIGGR